MYLTEYPNGEVRKRPRRPDGHSYPRKRFSKKTPRQEMQTTTLDNIESSSSDEEHIIDDINIDEFSDDEWSLSSDEDN